MSKKPQTSNQLRYDARLAFLDGRTKRARELNKAADKLDARARAAQRNAAVTA